MAITSFAGFWLAVGGALLMEALQTDLKTDRKTGLKSAGILLMLALAGATGASGQAPTPNTEGLPSGVVKLPQNGPEIRPPNAREAPPIWNSAAPGTLSNAQDQ